VDESDGLSRSAEIVSALRESIDGLPRTAAFFDATNVDEVKNWLHPEVVEFAGGWPLHDVHSSGSNRRSRYVNPNYMHSGMYPDVVVECECGKMIHRDSREGSFDTMADNAHADDCPRYERTIVRGRVAKESALELERLCRMGWRARQVAPRLGMSRNDIASFALYHEVDIKGLRDKYRAKAGATYLRLLDDDVLGSKVAEVYGHAQPTLSSWATKYTGRANR